MDRGDDAYGRFMSAIETDKGFRDAISNEDATKEMVSEALAAKNISLPAPFDEMLVDAIMNVTGTLPGTVNSTSQWSLFENMRRALLQISGPGPIG